MRLLSAAFLMLGTGGVPASAWAGAPLPVSDEQLLADERFVVAAVVVQAVRPAVGTKGQPPRVTLRVNSVLRGSLGARRVVDAVWLSEGYPCDYVPCSPPPEWLAQPLPGPRPGARMILMLAADMEGGFGVPERNRLADTPGHRAYVRKAIAEVTAERRQAEREYAADRQMRLESWRRTAAPAAIARWARDADFVAIGRLSSGPNQGQATFVVRQILKGVPRQPHGGPVSFADVPVPPASTDVLSSDMDVFLFLAENGMQVGGTVPRYPVVGDGLVLADIPARTIVKEALARAPARAYLPFCMLVVTNHAEQLGNEARWSLERRLADAFTSAGAGRCTIATNMSLSAFGDPRLKGDFIGKVYVGTSAAVLATIGHGGKVAFTGLRLRSADVDVVFSGESWPEAAADQHAAAVRMIERLIAPR